MVCRRSQIRRFALAAFVVALAIGVGEHTGFTSVDESASAATLRRVRVQKVTPAAAHPAHGFGILMGPDLPPVYTSLAENAPAGPVHEFMLPDTQLWVAEGPQSGGWRRGGYALVPDPHGVAQCSSDLSFGTDYSDVVVPAGSDEYLVCVRNLYQAPDLALEDVTITASSLASVSFSYRVVNVGPRYLDGFDWKVEVWVSRDAVLGMGPDVAVDEWFLPYQSLEPGEDFAGTRTVTLQNAAFTTLRYIIVRLLPGFPESNDANNSVAVAVPAVEVDRVYLPAVTASDGCVGCLPRLAANPSLALWVASVDASSHTVVINGADTRRPSIPMTFDWGDGTVTTGFFPQTHTYAVGGQYTVRVTAHYAGGLEGQTSTAVVV
jgi:hypothetical protein